MNASLAELLTQRLPRYTSYPTAPHFHDGIGDSAYRQWLAAVPAGRAASLYLHVPFCDKLCWYCGCNTTVVNQEGPVRLYAETLTAEIELVAAALPQRQPVSQIHWGGGSPNMMPGPEFKALMALLRERFSVQEGGEFAVELDPRIVTPAQIGMFAEAGINRASLGVQDFDPDVQKAINRIQDYEMTRGVVHGMRAAGVPRINLDLIYGLPLQTVESVLRTVDLTLALEPDRVALFGYAHVPWMKAHQKLLPEDKLPGAEERLEQYNAAAERLDAAGYVVVGLDHYARPDDPLAIAARAGHLRRNFQGYTTDEAELLIGMGASAIGSMEQGYIQNHPTVPRWREAINAGRLPVMRGFAVSAEDLLRRALIETVMTTLCVDVAEIAAAHGARIETFADALPALDRLAALGLLRREGWKITMTEIGRPFVRAAAAAFDSYLQPENGPRRHAIAV